jgi:hypothetical protein
MLIIQGVYWLVTGLWGLLDIDSFMKVTGPKTDVWLVKTVSILIIAISSTLLSSVRKNEKKTTAIFLAITSCVALATIDFYYSLNDVISDVYLLDGVIQTTFLIAWLIVLLTSRKKVDNN